MYPRPLKKANVCCYERSYRVASTNAFTMLLRMAQCTMLPALKVTHLAQSSTARFPGAWG